MDDNVRALFVYYSFTQNTRRVARMMAETLRVRGYEVTEAAIEFTDPRYGPRFSKLPMSWPIANIVGMLPAQLRKKTGRIAIPSSAAQSGYDLVIIGSPTWWLTTCMPVRSYLHDPAAARTLAGTPFAAFSTSRRYYKQNLGTIRELGTRNGGMFLDSTHFVSDGNQVMSMWSWLVFMRHNVERRRWFGIAMPKPNLKIAFEQQAERFINRVADKEVAVRAKQAAGIP
jgi:flavodoxin